MNNKMISITKVVTQNFIWDSVAKLQNLFGFNIITYEKMIQKGMDQIQQELKDNNIQLKWFRYETSQLTNGAMSVLLYGEKKWSYLNIFWFLYY